MEIDKLQMGLTLVSLSVEKLTNIVTAPPQCCPSLFELLTAAGGVTTISTNTANISGSYTSMDGELRSGGGGARGSSGSSSIGGGTKSAFGSSSYSGNRSSSSTPTFNKLFNSNKKMGYENISSEHSNMFTIECNDEDDT